jgi:hypothetical protein
MPVLQAMDLRPGFHPAMAVTAGLAREKGPAMMQSGKRISSRNTLFYKRLFPILWVGLFAVFAAIAVASTRRGPSPPPVVFLVPVLVFGIGYFLMRRLVLDLADEVYDEGDVLRVRFGGDEERIPLANIINISYAGMTNPQRITLTLRTPGRFGREVTFSPPQTFLGPLLRRNALVDGLIERVDAARRR